MAFGGPRSSCVRPGVALRSSLTLPRFPVLLHGDQPPYRLGIDRDLVLGRIGHIGQVQPRDEITILLVRQITQVQAVRG